MAQTTSVLWTTDQGLGEDAKAQARQNIGAAAATDIPTNKSEIKVFEGSKTVHKNLMTIYEDSTTGAMAGVTFNNENSKVSMVKEPAEGDAGKVLTVVEPGGQIAPYYEWKEPETQHGDVHYNLYKSYAINIGSNTSKQKVLFLSESAYNVRGFVSVMPENGGASIMPLSAGQTDIYTYTGSWDKVSNNINNYNLPSDSYTFIPFAWTTDYPIVAIGIKGNGAVSIGHGFVETIK